MGYTTDFEGAFAFDKPLTAAQVSELNAFNEEDHRHEPGAPDAWCQWQPTDDGAALVWNEVEKFYGYVEWLSFLIERFFKPWGRTLNGSVDWAGEDSEDQGVIHIKDNRVQAIPNIITKPNPSWTITKPDPKW